MLAKCRDLRTLPGTKFQLPGTLNYSAPLPLTLSTGNYFDKVREKENHSGKGAAIWIRTKKKKRSGVNYNNIINLHVMRFGGKNISGWRADYFVFEGGG